MPPLPPPPPSPPPRPSSPLLNHPKPPVFDASLLKHELNIPPQFIWPDHEKPSLHEPPPLIVPPIDLGAFLSGDPLSVTTATRLVDEACKKHGFFLVINHGLPWKETLSFRYCDDGGSSNVVEEYLVSTMGEDFRQFGRIYQDYSEAMNNLSLRIMELLGMSLGVGPTHLREFFEGNESIMRLNNYPPCLKAHETLGTGPHRDPNSLTILHQDNVGGLQVFIDQQWHSILPNSQAFVVNIGDTFMVST
ncbi:hypothetical protein HYC85_020769 [Camellia sinensis]|uniref:Fe2OG dioxygenase domain-containing protein n=1 Tax=Camellia sinensis TaxID=4442 RepID=A0A7J7GRQ6_CAMSI|nr:hypothetical protein HYC85_020769 [Camellia sinensis]